MYDIYAESMKTAFRADLYAIGSPAAAEESPYAHRMTPVDAKRDRLAAETAGRKPSFRFGNLARSLFSL